MVSELPWCLLAGLICGLWGWHTVQTILGQNAASTPDACFLLGMVLLTGLIHAMLPRLLDALCGVGILATLAALSRIDLALYRLPDHLTQPLLWSGLILASLRSEASVTVALYGAVAGYTFFWSANALWSLSTGQSGLGRGDMKLAAALGSWLGIERVPYLVSCSSGMALLAAGIVYCRYRTRTEAVAFGPYLSMAGMALFLCDNGTS